MAHDLKNRTTDVLNSENEGKTFEYFQFQGPILEGLEKNGYKVPSPIQVSALPYTLAGLDVLVQSKSGTGKTLVYVLSALSSIDVESKSLQGLLLAPTREIAVQGAQTMLEVGGHLSKMKASTFIGGMSIEEDKLKLSKCHMAFGSPGRVKQLIQEGIMNVEGLKVFIMDEADKLCEKSFQEDIKWIMSVLPESRQTIALSATYPNSLENTLMANLKTPSHVRLGQECQVLLGVKQFVLESPSHGLPQKVVDFKFERLLKLISSVSFEQCIVFCNYALRARAICDKLNDRGWPAIFLAGMQEQKDRLSALKDLRAFKCRIVLTTDLSARGIDARHVNFIINFDVPSSGTTYLHRIGRAGRYGSKGLALSIASKGKEMESLSRISHSTNSEVRIITDPEVDLWEVEEEHAGEVLKGEECPDAYSSVTEPQPEKLPPKAAKKKKKRERKSVDNEPSSIAKESLDALLLKEQEFEASLSEMMKASENMTLESVFVRAKEGKLLPQVKTAVNMTRPPPMTDLSTQWAQQWQSHQLQHQQYLDYMLKCQQ